MAIEDVELRHLRVQLRHLLQADGVLRRNADVQGTLSSLIDARLAQPVIEAN